MLTQNSQRTISSTGVVRRGRVLVKETSSIEPQYKNCKGKDIYKLNSEFQDRSDQEKTEAGGSCIDCFISASADGSISDIENTIHAEKDGSTVKGETKKSPYQSFKDQLRQRVLGQVKTKIAQTEKLHFCNNKGKDEDKDKQWLADRNKNIDLSTLEEDCKKQREDLHSSIKTRWSDMRVNLALTTVDSNHLFVRRPDILFASSIPHEISDFGSTPELTEEEQQEVKNKWAEELSKVSLDKFSPEQVKSQFLEGKPLTKASTKDLEAMKRATWDLQKQSRDRYRQIIEEMPLLGYMQTGDPENEEDMGQAFSKLTGHLRDLLKKVESEDVDMALLLSFEPLVEGLLKDNNSYCLVAEGTRLGAERDESLKKWGLVTAGVVAAVPCFMSGPPGMALCLGAGLAVGATGYSMAKGKTKEGLERFLTGREFETLASLSEKDSEAFWELMLLPTAAWGTTAGTAQFVKGMLKKGTSIGKQSSSPSGTSTVAKSSTRAGGSSSSAGIESYEDTLGRLARSSLGVDDLSPQQIEALENYHSVVRGEKGPDGTPARAGNYTVGQRRKIIRYLESQGFSREQVRRLIEDGVVEVNRMINIPVHTRRVLKDLSDGKIIFFSDSKHAYQPGGGIKIRKVLERDDYGILVEVEKVDSSSGQLIKEELYIRSDWDKHITLVNPEFEDVFLAASSNRKKIDSKDLNLPPPTNREAKLVEQGYKSSYVGGLDQVNEWNIVRRRLQELKANPRTTHIEYFADQIPDHIAHIRKGLEENYSPLRNAGSKLEQLKRLEDLEREAKQAISDEKVTYEWWLQFNNKLSGVMAGKNPKEIGRDRITEHLNHFPLKILIPTTREEDIGIMAFNRAGTEGIYPAGLTNKQENYVDHTVYDPHRFFEHDLAHAEIPGNQSFVEYSAGYRLFHKRLLRNMENLPPDKRKKAEAVYFTMTHEGGWGNLSDANLRPSNVEFHHADFDQDELLRGKNVIDRMKTIIAVELNKNSANLFRFSDDPAQKEKKIKDLADTFMEVYNRAQQHQ